MNYATGGSMHIPVHSCDLRPISSIAFWLHSYSASFAAVPVWSSSQYQLSDQLTDEQCKWLAIIFCKSLFPLRQPFPPLSPLFHHHTKLHQLRRNRTLQFFIPLHWININIPVLLLWRVKRRNLQKMIASHLICMIFLLISQLVRELILGRRPDRNSSERRWKSLAQNNAIVRVEPKSYWGDWTQVTWMYRYVHTPTSCIVHRLLLLFFFTCFIDADTSDYYVGGDTGAIETGLCSVYRWMTCYCVVVSLQEAVAIDRLEKHIKKSNQQLDRAEQTALSLKYPHLEQDRDWVSEGVKRDSYFDCYIPHPHMYANPFTCMCL